MSNAESVRQFQPRVAFWQPWVQILAARLFATLKGLRTERNEVRVSQGCQSATAGLELANAFSVNEISPGIFAPRVSRQTLGLTLANAFSVFLRAPMNFRFLCKARMMATAATLHFFLANFLPAFFVVRFGKSL